LALQVYDGGPMDPRELNLNLWIKLTQTNGVRGLPGGATSLITWISDVTDHLGLRAMPHGAR
jgi:hypothetical protein